MSIQKADLVALRSQIERDADRLEQELASLREEIRALDVIEKRVSANQSALNLEEPAQPVKSSPFAQITAFSDAVKEAAMQFGAERFTPAHVENLLKAKGVKLPAANVRARISTELKRLTDTEKLKCVFTGTGNQPNQYIVISGQDAGKGEAASGAASFTH